MRLAGGYQAEPHRIHAQPKIGPIYTGRNDRANKLGVATANELTGPVVNQVT